MSLRMRRDPSKYQSSTQQNSLILALKVDVYGMKGGNCLEKKSTIMLELIMQKSQGENQDAIS